MRRLIYLMAAGLMLCFSSCDEPFDSAFRAYTDDPVALYLQSRPEFSDWVAVLNKTGLFNSLNLTSTKTTHFVVKNDALKKYAKDIFGADNILDVATADLKEFVKYHTIPNYKISARNMSGKISRRTATKDYLTAVYDYENNTRYILNGDKAPSYFIEPDIEVTNGYIHVLDTPLVTEFKTLWDVLKNRTTDDNKPMFSIFCAALEETGLDQYLKNTSVTFEFGPSKVDAIAKDEKTVFAVPNDVYGNYEIIDYAGLKRYLDLEVGVTDDPKNPNSVLYQYVAYHIVPKRMAYTDLAVFPLNLKVNDGITRFKRSTVFTYSQVAELQRGISIEDQLSGLVFNPHKTSVGNSFVITSRDVPASNGYIQIISNIMLKPDRMAYFPVEYEPTDDIKFRAIDFYQDYISEGVPAKTFDFYEGDLDNVSWTSSSSDMRVWYSNVWMDNNRFLNQDAIYFTLGSVGTIDFALPPLPMTGTDLRYSIYMEKGVDPYSGGRYRVAVNRQELSTNDIDFKNGAKMQEYGRLRLGVEEISTLRFKVGDFGGMAGIDRFLFIPTWSGGTPLPEIYYNWEDVPK